MFPSDSKEFYYSPSYYMSPNIGYLNNNQEESAMTPDNEYINNVNSFNMNFIGGAQQEEMVNTAMNNIENINNLNSQNYNNIINPQQMTTQILPADLDINQIVSSSQIEVRTLYTNYRFEEILKYLNSHFPNFLMLNKEVLYLLMKLIFFDKLLMKTDINSAESFYFEYFRNIGKEMRKNWDRKEQVFLKLLKNPTILKSKNVFEKNFQNFMLDLTRALFKYLYDSRGVDSEISGQPEFHEEYTSPIEKSPEIIDIIHTTTVKLNNIALDNNSYKTQFFSPLTNNNQEINNFGNNNININLNNNTLNDPQNNNNDDQCHNEEEMKNLSVFSTKEEFSDFEDEIEGHIPCGNNEITEINLMANSDNQQASTEYAAGIVTNLQTNQIPNNLNEDSIYINPTFLDFINKQNKIEDHQQIQNLPIYPNHKLNNPYFKDPNANFNFYKKEFIPKTQKTEENIAKKLPLLKSFKPKYTKRENVDKKIIRKFKFYLKEKYKLKFLKIDQTTEKHFWIMFINGDLLPPMKYVDKNTDEFVEFKSFNTKFMLWLFNKRGAREYYDQFIKEEGNAVISNISADYGVNDNNELNQLEYYMNNLAFIFDMQTMTNEKNSPPTTIPKPSIHTPINSQSPQNSLKAPNPTMNNIKHYDIFSESNHNSSKKTKHSSTHKRSDRREVEDYSDDELVKFNRKERSREMDCLNFDHINEFENFYSGESEEDD